MPLIQSNTLTNQTDDENQLVQELYDEMVRAVNTSQPITQPFIIEQKISPTNYLHVTVVWEKWRLISAGRRGAVIMKAYEKAAPDRVNDITIAMGVTTEEAIDLGLLPFEVVPTIRKSDDFTEEQQKMLMKDEGAIATPSGLSLRFPSRNLADTVCERLWDKSSRNYWAVVQMTSPQG